jgi:hypothetical protein
LRDPELPYAEIAESKAALARVPLTQRKKKLSESDQAHLVWLGETRHRVVWAERRTLPEIFASIAADESKRRGIPISPRQVRRWRDEYQKTKAKT